MQTKRLTAAITALVAGLGLAACSATTTTSATTTSSVGTASSTTGASTAQNAAAGTDGSGSTTATSALLTDNAETHAESDDADYEVSEAITITLADGAATASSETGVSIDGDTVTISAPGTYVLSGTLTNGSVVVNSDAEGKVRLVLDDASITNSAGAAINIQAADEAVVVLAEGSSNTLADGSGYDTSAEDAPNAALFSMADLTIAGTGELAVTGNT